MQQSTTFDWGRVVTPLRWIAQVLGVGAALLFGLLLFSVWFSGEVTWDASQFMLAGIAGVTGVGLLVAIFWKGIGELIGGLVILGAGVVFVVNGALNVGLQLGALTAIAPFALVGALFVACGWYTLAQRSHHAPHAMA